MSEYYQINGFFKNAEQDIYNKGSQIGTGCACFVDHVIQCESLDDLIQKAMDFIGVKDKQNVLLNACDENGRIDFQVYEDDNGSVAGESKMNQWKEGNARLWLCDYSCCVSYVSKKTDFDLLPLVKNSTDYTINS